MIEVRNFPAEAVVYVTFANKVTDSELFGACNEVIDIARDYAGAVHLTCSDLLHLRMPLTPAQEQMLGVAVAKTRQMGMRFCVHVVDPLTVRGLQLSRALAGAAQQDCEEVTVHTLDEASDVLRVARRRLGLPPQSLGRIAHDMQTVQSRLARLSKPD
jgi:hypothetical protein